MITPTYVPVELEHLEYFYKWLNDPDTIRNLYNSLPTNRAKVEAFIRQEIEQQYPLTFMQCVEGEPIGFFRLHDLNFINRKVEMTMAIGEAAYRGQGYGRHMMEKMIDYSFWYLNLEQVYFYVYKRHWAIPFYEEKLGFVREGEFRVLKYDRGEPVPGLRMSLFRDEYKLNKREESQ